MTNSLDKYFSSSLSRFESLIRKVRYKNRGILPSEAFAFCSFLDAFRPDIIIESGMAYGYSTEIWARYFRGPVYTIDTAAYGKPLFWFVKFKLLRFRSVRVIYGSSITIIPRLLGGAVRGRRVALFIDGPKNEKAIRLAQKCLDAYDEILYVGIHDMDIEEHSPYRELLRGWDKSFFFTDEMWFRERYGYLDERYLPEEVYRKKKQRYVNGNVIGFAKNAVLG